MIKSMNVKMGFIVLVTIVTSVLVFRLIPHPPNFSPVSALALFAGFLIRPPYLALLVSCAGLLISDYFLGFYSGMAFTYIGFIASILLASGFLKKFQWSKLAGASLVSSLVFFAISNFGVWVVSKTYTPDLSGLAASYLAGIPFLKNALLGNLIFSFGFFGVYRWLESKNFLPVLETYRARDH